MSYIAVLLMSAEVTVYFVMMIHGNVVNSSHSLQIDWNTANKPTLQNSDQFVVNVEHSKLTIVIGAHFKCFFKQFLSLQF